MKRSWSDAMMFNEDGERAYVDGELYDTSDVYQMVIDYHKETVGDFDELPAPSCITIERGYWEDIEDDPDGMQKFTKDDNGKEYYFIKLA